MNILKFRVCVCVVKKLNLMFFFSIQKIVDLHSKFTY